MKSALSQKSTLLILSVLFLTGLFLRIYNIGNPSVVKDEYKVVRCLEYKTVGSAIVCYESLDNNPYETVVILYYVNKIFPGLENLRIFGAIVSALIIPASFWFLYPMIGKRKSLILAALSCFSYQMIYFARFIRPYQFSFLLTLLVIGFFIRIVFWDKSSFGSKVGFILSSAFCFYISYTITLVWVFLAIFFVLSECFRSQWKFSQLRWNKFKELGVMSLMILVLLTPMMEHYFTHGLQRHVIDTEKVKPDIILIYKALMSVGFGTGWQAAVFLFVISLGVMRLIRFNLKLLSFVLCTMILPPLICMLLLGMPMIFYYSLAKYFFPIVLGFIVFLAFGIDEMGSWILRFSKGLFTRRLKLKPFVVHACVLVCMLSSMTKVYAHFYHLSAAGTVYHEIGKTLKSLGNRSLLNDNCYDAMYLSYYLPDNIRLESPPPFSSTDDYRSPSFAAYIQSLAASNPMLMFYDSIERDIPNSQAMWGWLDQLYQRKIQFINPDGLYLSDRCLNYYADFGREDAVHWPTMEFPTLYYNELNDLPLVFEKLGNKAGVALLSGWNALYHMDPKREIHLVRVLDNQSTISVYSKASKRIELQMWLYGCNSANTLTLTSDRDKTISKKCSFPGVMTTIYDNAMVQNEVDYAPLNKIARQYIPQKMLHAYNQVFNTKDLFEVPFKNFTMEVDVVPDVPNIFTLTSSDGPWNIVVGGIIAKEIERPLSNKKL